MKLEFDEEKHEYRIDGIVVPSVTQVLVRSGLIDTQWFSEHGRMRGSAVHKAIHYLQDDDLNWDSVDDEIKPYLSAWRKFNTDVNFEMVRSEKHVYDPIYRYAGTYDMIGFIGSRNIILDIKTGVQHPSTALQLAAYAKTFTNPLERYALHLNNDGSYKLIHYSDHNDIKTFLSALAIANWKQNKGLI